MALAALYVCFLTMVGLGFNATYSIYNTLARTPPGTAGAADTGDILAVAGGFDGEQWLNGEGSGLEVTNVSAGRLWVYFTVDGTLGEAVQHVNPVCLQAGESFEVPVIPAQVGELGLLDWRNNDRVFTGTVMARVLNNYAVYEVSTVTIRGADLYEKVVNCRDDAGGEIMGIRNVEDILRLIAEKLSLTDERDRLLDERALLQKQLEELEAVNDALVSENEMLMYRVYTLEENVHSLSESLDSASQTIQELRDAAEPAQPEEEPAAAQPAGEQQAGGQTGQGGAVTPAPDENETQTGDEAQTGETVESGTTNTASGDEPVSGGDGENPGTGDEVTDSNQQAESDSTTDGTAAE